MKKQQIRNYILTLLLILGSAQTFATTLPLSEFPILPNGAINTDSIYRMDIFSKSTIYSQTGGSLYNASGITHNAKENLLYVILNNLGQIHVYEANNALPSSAFKSIDLVGWGTSAIANDIDLEDIVYLGETESGESEFALVNEGTPQKGADVYICKIHAELDQLNRKNCDRIHVDIPINKKNKGAEGIAYDSKNKIFYISVEGNENGKFINISKFPRPATNSFRIDPTGTHSLSVVTATPLFNAEEKLGSVIGDISAIFFNEKNQRLYVLSHVSEKAIDIDLAGNIYGSFKLPTSLQFEGMTLDTENNILFLSEPNKLYKYLKQ